MRLGKKNIYMLLILLSLTLVLTDFCVAILLYPKQANAVRPAAENHLDCGQSQEQPTTKVKITKATAGSSLLPCCMEQNQNGNLALVATETPLTLTVLVLESDYNQNLSSPYLRGHTTTLQIPPEQKIINSTIIRV